VGPSRHKILIVTDNSFYYTFLYHIILYWDVMSLDLTEIEDNSVKKQKARNELFNLLDKAYYVDSIKSKIDNTSDLEYND
jgi:hypothetical protein